MATAVKAAEAGATEVHVVGGLHPWMKFDYYTDMMSGIRAACPELHIKAFTAIEIVHLARIGRRTVREVLSELKDAGLGSLPGGGAEIFDDRVHDEAFKGKVRADKWFDVHRTAHGPRPLHECDHALRPCRNAGGAGGALDQIARGAGGFFAKPASGV